MHPNSTDIQAIIDHALSEDIGKGDITARLLVPEEALASLFFVNREPLILCGVDVVRQVFATLDARVMVTPLSGEGQKLGVGQRLIEVKGPARAVLAGERTALNLLQRMSSVATYTARYVEEIKGTPATILDTRKTMPCLRVLDKYAVRVGGGRNHRMRLDDGILIKDNHIALCGGVKDAIEKAQRGNSEGLPIEIECDTLLQVDEALTAGADIILLDNMHIDVMKEAVSRVAGRAKLEASGNMRLETVRAVAETGVDYISVGRITHSVPNVDIGLDCEIAEPEKRKAQE